MVQATPANTITGPIPSQNADTITEAVPTTPARPRDMAGTGFGIKDIAASIVANTSVIPTKMNRKSNEPYEVAAG